MASSISAFAHAASIGTPAAGGAGAGAGVDATGGSGGIHSVSYVRVSPLPKGIRTGTTPSTSEEYTSPGEIMGRIDRVAAQIRGTDGTGGAAEVSARLSPMGVAKEEGDSPICDTLFNPISAACFETGAALTVLDAPGAGGERVDYFANRLATTLERLKAQGDRMIKFRGKLQTVKAVLAQTILKTMGPRSDQIGRCRDMSLADRWNDEGLDWIIGELKKSTTDSSYNYEQMLVKIKAIADFSDLMIQLVGEADKDEAGTIITTTGNMQVLGEWLDKAPAELLTRFQQVKAATRHEGFNDPVKRARQERPPVIGGRSIHELAGHPVPHTQGPGFGRIFAEASFTEGDADARAIYMAELSRRGGPGGMERKGAAISDASRPGLITDEAQESIPIEFRVLGLPDAITSRPYSHGIGVNRWRLTGEYAKDCWELGLPAAGSHSGTTADIMIGCECLSEETIFGGEAPIQELGNIIHAFMVFGACHTMAEVIPIVDAVAQGRKFEVEITDEHRDLYKRYLASVRRMYTEHMTAGKGGAGESEADSRIRAQDIEAYHKIEKYLAAYCLTTPEHLTREILRRG